MATFRIIGLDQMQKQLEQLQKNAEEMDGKHSVPFDELFPPEFMQEHSSFASMQALVNASSFKDMEFDKIPDAEWDDYVRKTTDFPTWKEMQNAAVKLWGKTRLTKGAEGFSKYVSIRIKS